MTIPGYPPVPISGDSVSIVNLAAATSWVRVIADRINKMLTGKLNVTYSLTLTPNAGTTTVTDARIGPFNALLLQPKTANAAAALATTYVSSQGTGTATFMHTNNAQTDKSFNLVIIG